MFYGEPGLPSWQLVMPGWMIGREQEIKRWFEDNEDMLSGLDCTGVTFNVPIGGGFSLDEHHIYDYQSGRWA